LPQKGGFARTAHTDHRQGFALNLGQPNIALRHAGHGARLGIHDFFREHRLYLAF
jgi:hypothetical protein